MDRAKSIRVLLALILLVGFFSFYVSTKQLRGEDRAGLGVTGKRSIEPKPLKSREGQSSLLHTPVQEGVSAKDNVENGKLAGESPAIVKGSVRMQPPVQEGVSAKDNVEYGKLAGESPAIVNGSVRMQPPVQEGVSAKDNVENGKLAGASPAIVNGSGRMQPSMSKPAVLSPPSLMSPVPPWSGAATEDSAPPPTAVDTSRFNPVARFQTIRREFRHLNLQAHLEQIPVGKAVEAGAVYRAWDRERWKGAHRDTAGLRIAPGKNVTDIKEIWIWGERHSCTSLLTSVLSKAFNRHLRCGRKDCVWWARPWKHDFARRRPGDVDSRVLHVMVTKDPYGWTHAMQVKPYHSGLHMGLRFEDLLTTEWAGFTEYGALKQRVFQRYLASGKEARKVQHKPLGSADGMQQCVTDGRVDASGAEDCLFEGAHYRCTLAPGFRLNFGTEPAPADACLAGALSRSNCVSRFLCKVGAALPWQDNPEGWIRTIQGQVEQVVERTDGPCYALNDEASSVLNTACGRPPDAGHVYACALVPHRLQEHEDDPSPSPHCLPGKQSWGRCDGGRFLCNLRSDVFGPQIQQQLAAESKKQRGELVADEQQVVRRAYVDARAHLPLVGEWSRTEVYNDRDPDTGHRFPNLLALRTARLRDWMQEAERMHFSAHVQCRALLMDQAGFLGALANKFGLKQDSVDLGKECVFDSGKCIRKQGGADKAKETLEATYLKQFTPTTLEMANAWLDPEVEAYFGYQLLAPSQLPPARRRRRSR